MSLILPAKPITIKSTQDPTTVPFETPMIMAWKLVRQALDAAEWELSRYHGGLVGIVNGPATLTANQLRTIARMTLHGHPIPCPACFAQTEHDNCPAWDVMLKPNAPNRDEWEKLRVEEDHAPAV